MLFDLLRQFDCSVRQERPKQDTEGGKDATDKFGRSNEKQTLVGHPCILFVPY